MLNQKEREILQLFNENTEDYLTSQKIAYHLDVSDKTARKYVKLLDDKLNNHMACIESVSGHGYQLISKDWEAFKTFCRKYAFSKQSIENQKEIESVKDRQHFILHRVFFEETNVYLKSLLTELYVSRSTLLSDISKMNTELKKFDLFLKVSEKDGLRIDGKEQSKRHFIMKYFFVDHLQNTFKSTEELSTLLTDISLEEILLIVLDECRDDKLYLSDTIMFNIVVHIALALKRVQEGNQLGMNVGAKTLNTELERKTARKIIARLEKSSAIHLPDEEVDNIALHLKNKSSNKVLLETQQLREQDIHEQIQTALKDLDTEAGCDFSLDSILLEGLTAHFIPFIIRLKNNNCLKNPLLKETRSQYPYLFEITKRYFSNMDILKDKEVSDDEWAYLALHVIASYERKLKKRRIHTLVICATGIGSSQMLKVRLENELGSKIIIDDVISYFEITDKRLEGIDLIISSIDLSNMMFNIPVAEVSVLLSETDIKRINQVLSKNFLAADEKKSPPVQKKENIEQIITEFLDPELFVYTEKELSRQQAIQILVEQSMRVDESINPSFLNGQLEFREKLSSVIFSKNLAIPHPIEGVAAKAKIAVLAAPKGVHWEGHPSLIKLVMLLLPDRYGNQNIEEASKSFVPLIEYEEYVEELAKRVNYQSFSSKLIKYLS